MAKSEVSMTPGKFRALIWRFYREHGRHDLPWRENFSVYRVLVSEIMLQQTQVDRVIPFYTRFMKAYPTARKLAEAPLSDVLRDWQGLGYNRRAKMLHAAAKMLSVKKVKTIADLEALPGVGSYTARAVASFAFNQDTVVIETNIRTVVIHHFFKDDKKVSDAAIEKILERCMPKGRAREWYSALMDYGSYLKRSGISHNVRSIAHVKQSAFKGSLREARGAILRELSKRDAARTRLEGLLGPDRIAQLHVALDALIAEGLVEGKRSRYRLAE